MSSVYRSSKLTLIWLGAKTEADAASICLLYQIEEIRQNPAATKLDKEDAVIKLIRHPDHQEKNLASLDSLFCKSWCSRVWVVQEFALSPNIQMNCGHSVLPVDAIGLLVDIFYEHPFASFSYSYTNLFDRLRQLAHFTDPRPIQMSVCNVVHFAAVAVLKASDERDHLYGFLGLLNPDDRSRLLPDYGLDPTNAFTSAMEAILTGVETTSNFWQFLHLASGCRPISIGLPSWVIHFPSANMMGSCLSEYNIFSASRDSMQDFSFEDSGSVLRISGKIIDSVKTICRPPPHGSENDSWPRKCFDLLNANLPSYKTGESSQDICWRMMVCDLHNPGGLAVEPKRAMEGFGSSYLNDAVFQNSLTHDVLATDTAMKSALKEQRDYQLSMLRSSTFKDMCITQRRLAGCLGPHSQKDDTICIFSGSSVPHIIRELPNGNYHLVGEAYIHGIMDGEVMDWEGIEWKDIRLA